jgi:hypothetical protein
MNLLAITGSYLVILSIATGWLIVAKRYLALGPIVRLIKDDRKLVKGHMEYPVMALLLFAFYTLSPSLPYCLVMPACIGAFTNPSLQIILSIKPDIDKRATAPFGIISTLSFIVTSTGLGGLSAVIIYNLLK